MDNLNGNELVQKLIRGSENIDRMKREIDLVVKTIVGLIPFALKERTDMFQSDFSFYNFGYDWDILLHGGGADVSCRLLNEGGEYSLFNGVSKFPEVRKIKLIHDGLHVLLTGFMQFKAMQKHLAPFLDAADYKF